MEAGAGVQEVLVDLGKGAGELLVPELESGGPGGSTRVLLSLPLGRLPGQLLLPSL
jgi:hypothetical protein